MIDYMSQMTANEGTAVATLYGNWAPGGGDAGGAA